MKGPPSTQTPPEPRLAEYGAAGATSDRRLFMQLLAWTGCADAAPVIDALAASGFEAVLYHDVLDPRGLALLTVHEDPAFFPGALRSLLATEPFAALTPRPELTMFGRTYSLGYEPDLDETLLNRPRRHAMNADWPWAVWYPLRRKGEFEQLDRETKMSILKEHGTIGMGFGQADAGHDIRLACHGLDTRDNDFVVGLVGKDLAPLSKLVQTMRSTQQTSRYLASLGPFFVGHAAWRSTPA